MNYKVFLRKSWDFLFQRKKVAKYGTGAIWYLDDKILNKNSIVYSGGVGHDISFEIKLAKKVKTIYLYDPSPTGIKTINKIKLPKNVKFFDIGIARKNGVITFSEPMNFEEGSYTTINNKTKKVKFKCKSIKTLIKENKTPKIDLLKIDIEGFEYEVLEEMIKDKIYPKQILVEYHHFFKTFTRFDTFKNVILLYRHGYRLIYKDMTNYTFVRS